MTTANDRKALHAFVSDDAHASWHDFSAEEGISVSALLESLSGALADRPALAGRTFDDVLDEMVKQSRRVDARRRRRNQRSR